MKVIKRDGRAVEYSPDKIEIAIDKANKEVSEEKRATNQEIKQIIKYIESLNKKRILVEDIQDIIEQKLMEIKKYELAKKYIVYRYTRALVRKQNTTDESILGLIKNNTQEKEESLAEDKLVIAATQRNLIAAEVSKDLTKRMLLPEKITRAHEDGVLYFHDAEYFLQPIFNSCFVNLEDMLENGTCMNGKKVETPKGFQVACTLTTQIIALVASGQYGEQGIDISVLGRYLRKTKEKITEELSKYSNKIPIDIMKEMIEERVKTELKNGIQTIEYQINTLLTTNGKLPQVTIYLNIKEKDKFEKENLLIIEEILRQHEIGIENCNGKRELKVPKLIYVINKKYEQLNETAKKCAEKIDSVTCITKEEMKKIKFNGEFNQGIVTINLPQIAILAEKDEQEFWKLIEERLDLCQEALMCRHYALMGTFAKISPIHWQYGAVARLDKNETIDKLLVSKKSNLKLGYIGIDETVKAMKKDVKDREIFLQELMKKLNNSIQNWTEMTGIQFLLDISSSKTIGKEFIEIDKEKFGIMKDITDKDFYTN